MTFKGGMNGRLMHAIVCAHAHFDDLDLDASYRSQWLGGEGNKDSIEISEKIS